MGLSRMEKLYYITSGIARSMVRRADMNMNEIAESSATMSKVIINDLEEYCIEHNHPSKHYYRNGKIFCDFCNSFIKSDREET